MKLKDHLMSLYAIRIMQATLGYARYRVADEEEECIWHGEDITKKLYENTFAKFSLIINHQTKVNIMPNFAKIFLHKSSK